MINSWRGFRNSWWYVIVVFLQIKIHVLKILTLNYNQVTGLCLAAYNIFLLPLDIANQQGLADNPDAFDAAKVEAGFFITTCVYILAIVPFSVFFYEGYDDVSDSGDLE